MKTNRSSVTALKLLPLTPVAWVVTYLCLIHPNPGEYSRRDSIHPGLYCRSAVCRLPGAFWVGVYKPLIRLDRFLYPQRWDIHI